MNAHRLFLLGFLILSANAAFSQKLKKADKVTLANLKAHVAYLADDRLEGRRAGSAGEQLAMEYIRTKMQEAGLSPRGENGFLQPFPIHEGKKADTSSYFIINEKPLSASDYFPLPYSAEKSVEATPAIALQEADMPWFVDLKEVLEENKNNPHFDIHDYIRKNTQRAYDKGATAILLYNTSDLNDGLNRNS